MDKKDILYLSKLTIEELKQLALKYNYGIQFTNPILDL